jgi:hypothetical protein
MRDADELEEQKKQEENEADRSKANGTKLNWGKFRAKAKMIGMFAAIAKNSRTQTTNEGEGDSKNFGDGVETSAVLPTFFEEIEPAQEDLSHILQPLAATDNFPAEFKSNSPSEDFTPASITSKYRREPAEKKMHLKFISRRSKAAEIARFRQTLPTESRQGSASNFEELFSKKPNSAVSRRHVAVHAGKELVRQFHSDRNGKVSCAELTFGEVRRSSLI